MTECFTYLFYTLERPPRISKFGAISPVAAAHGYRPRWVQKTKVRGNVKDLPSRFLFWVWVFALASWPPIDGLHQHESLLCVRCLCAPRTTDEPFEWASNDSGRNTSRCSSFFFFSSPPWWRYDDDMTTTVSTLVRWNNTQQQANTARALENRLSAGERSPIAATRDRRGLKYTQTGGKTAVNDVLVINTGITPQSHVVNHIFIDPFPSWWISLYCLRILIDNRVAKLQWSAPSFRDSTTRRIREPGFPSPLAPRPRRAGPVISGIKLYFPHTSNWKTSCVVSAHN